MTKQIDYRALRLARVQRDVPASPAAIHCYAQRDSGLHAISLEEGIAELNRVRSLPVKKPLVWIDIINPGAVEEALMRERLGLHQLAVEDCMRGRQRPKLDRYNGYFFLVVYAARFNQDRQRTALEELHVFVGEQWIVTVHDHKMRIVNEVIVRWRANEAAFPTTPALAHGLLDGVVDSYLPVIDHLGVHVDDIEHKILADTATDLMTDLLELRHEVATTRRLLSPLQEIVHTLIRRDAGVLEEQLTPFFQDVLDHVKRETEELDSLRDTLAATLNAYLSISANNLNHTLRIMTAWSIILMAMAWLAGVYGMNFDLMPELHWRYGYLWALGLMLVTGGGLLYFFRRRGWL